MMKIYSCAAWLWTLTCWTSPALMAAECSAESGAQRVALVELYSSEGCSSCPPADRWLGMLQKHGWDASKVIPLALHVDYWDYIGWKDRFANPLFTRRQQAQAALHHSSLVYTPQATLNGLDYRAWSDASQFAQDINALNRRPAQATIQLAAKQQGAAWKVSVRVNAPAQSALYLVLTESDLSTTVKAGENRGERLHHDHIARIWQGPVQIPADSLNWETTLGFDPQWQLANSRLVAFVQSKDGEVLQALLLPLCASA